PISGDMEVLEAKTPVKLTVLGLAGEPTVPGSVIEAWGSHVVMKLDHAIPTGSLVKLECADTLLLGEVSRLLGDGSTAEVMLAYSLQGLADLERLNRSLLGEEMGEEKSRRLEP